jgi:putative spermidine/putrescine transport system permease protein
MADVSIALAKPIFRDISWPSARFWLAIACTPLLAFLLMPILLVVPMAFTKGQILVFPPQGLSVRPFMQLFSDSQWMASAWTSFKVGLVATLLATLVGSASAVALNRSRIPLKGGITAVILLPITIPAVVLALGYYLFFLRLQITGSWLTIALAHSVLTTPYVFVAVQASLSGFDPSLARAARSLGAGSRALLRHVYWPAIRPGVLGGAIFAFIGSFDEVVISIFLTGPTVVTLPVQMFNSLQMDLTPKIAAASAMLLLLSITGLTAQAVQSAARAKRAGGTSGPIPAE